MTLSPFFFLFFFLLSSFFFVLSAIQNSFQVLGNGTGDFELEWDDISWDDYRVFTGGVQGGAPAKRHMFFADADGRLLEHKIELPQIAYRAELYRALKGANKTTTSTTSTTTQESKTAANDHSSSQYTEGGRRTKEERRITARLWKSHGSPNGNGIALVGAAMNVYPLVREHDDHSRPFKKKNYVVGLFVFSLFWMKSDIHVSTICSPLCFFYRCFIVFRFFFNSFW